MKEHNDKDLPWLKDQENQTFTEKEILNAKIGMSILNEALKCNGYSTVGYNGDEKMAISYLEDSTPDENPPEPPKAIRHDQGKPRMDLLSPIAMFGTAAVLTKGLEKYPGSQWKKGMAWSKVIASTLRHFYKFMAGEDYDNESGHAHIDHVAANVMFLQEYFRRHKALDDRMKTGLE